MLQRKPTRIELKPDDAKDFDLFWKETSQKRKQHQHHHSSATGDEDNPGGKTTSEIVKERVGYHPKPQNVEGQALR